MKNVYFSVHRNPPNTNPDTGNNPYFTSSNPIENIPNFIQVVFSRISFIYYMLMLIIQLKCDLSLNISVTLIPLLLSLFTSALSYFTTLRRRMKFVQKINKMSVEVLRSRKWTSVRWGDVRVGDIVRLTNNDIAPADLVLLKTSDGTPVSVETTIIDGSTQLSPRTPPDIPELIYEGALLNTTFSINNIKREVYNDPTQVKNTLSSRFNFSAELDFEGKKIDLTAKQFIERYSTVFHSGYLIGAVIFTGQNCWTVKHKLFKSRPTNLEKTLNSMNIWQIAILLTSSLVMAIKSFSYFPVLSKWPFTEEITPFTYFMHNLRNYLVLLLPLTPLELYAFIDIICLFNSNVLKHSLKKAYVPNPQCLYDVSHIDSLITSKSMLLEQKPCLKRIYMNGNTYGKDVTIRELSVSIENNLLENRSVLRQFVDPSLVASEETRMFFLHLTLCHSATLVGSKDSTLFQYVSRFPDDEQLLRLAAASGFILVGRTMEDSYVMVGDKTYIFKTKRIIHSSLRHPRISIIVEDSDGTLILFTRGVYKVMTNIVDNIEKCQSTYEIFHEDGLHVECCSYKYLTPKQYKRFEEKLSEFGNENADFEFSVVENLESHSSFLAMLGFEDQPRDGALLFLARAKTSFNKIVLSSQSKGTSLVITGISLGIIKNNPIVGTISGSMIDDVEISVSYLLETLSYDVIIINGCTVEFLTQTQYASRVAKLILNTRTIILQRADQYQAAQFVKYLQNTLKQTVLAVGHSIYDSTYMVESDVSISNEANDLRPCNVSSDIITNNFNQICDIIYLHGNWMRERIDTVVNFVLVRNMFFGFLQFWFNIYTACSGTPLFREPEIISVLWFFTFLPLLSRSIINEKYDQNFIMSNPYFYKEMNKENITKKRIMTTTLLTCIGAYIFLVISKHILTPMGTSFGSTISYPHFSIELATIFLICCVGALIPQCNTWSIFHHFMMWGSIILYFAMYCTISALEISGQDMTVAFHMFASPVSDLYILLCFIISFSVQSFYSYYNRSMIDEKGKPLSSKSLASNLSSSLQVNSDDEIDQNGVGRKESLVLAHFDTVDNEN